MLRNAVTIGDYITQSVGENSWDYMSIANFWTDDETGRDPGLYKTAMTNNLYRTVINKGNDV